MNVLQVLFDPLMLPFTVAMAAGLLAYLLGGWLPSLCRLVSLLGSAAVLACAVAVPVARVETLRAVWVEQIVPNVSLSVELSSSPLGLIVMIGSAAFAVLVAVYAWQAMAGRRGEGRFHAYMLWALGGACLVGLAGNLLVLLVGWEIVTLMLFLLVNLGRKDAPRGAAKAYGILGFADACLLLAIALLCSLEGGSANWSLTAAARSVSALGPIGYFIYVLILVAAMAKAGAIPVHSWLPSIAKDAPTPVLAYLPAALDKLLGIYLLAVLSLRMFQPDWAMQVVMMSVGGVTIIAAVLMAMMQHNLKRLLSFHAVSQVGYMLLGIGTGTAVGVVGGLFHMLNNAVYKSNLFFMSGAVRRVTGSDEIEDMGGLGRVLPVTFVCGAISALAISGVPPLNGFVSKWLIYQGTLDVPSRGLAMALATAAVFGSALTLASFVKVLYSAFLSEAPKAAAWRENPPRESFCLAAPMVVLALACLVLGVWPGLATETLLAPAVAGAATEGIAPQTDAWLHTIATGHGIWESGPATVLAVIGLGIGGGLIWIAAHPMKIRVVRPFLCGELPVPGDDRYRVPGSHFYETVAKLPGIGPLLFHGEKGAMDLYHWSGKHGNTLVQMLRAQHTGLISLYVAWCLLGLVATLVYLLVSAGI